MNADALLISNFKNSATKQVTRMHYTNEDTLQNSTSTPTNSSNSEKVDLKVPEVFVEIPSKYISLKERIEYKLIASGNLKRSIIASDENHHIYQAVRTFFFDLNDRIDSPKNIRHIRLVAVNENDFIKEHFGDVKFALTIKSILHKLIPLANSKQI